MVLFQVFSKNNRSTIITLDERYQDLIGESTGLSFKDIKLANLIYECSCKCLVFIRVLETSQYGSYCKSSIIHGHILINHAADMVRIFTDHNPR